jgi:hypothetical protein
MDPSRERYVEGRYDAPDIDGSWKAEQMFKLLRRLPDRGSIRKYADVGCWRGAVLISLVELLRKNSYDLEEIAAYDISPFPSGLREAHPDIEFRQGDFLKSAEPYDLVTLNDVLEHLSAPQSFLAGVGERARYVALHIPLDDRLSVILANQYNFRLQQVGHISFWNASSALNLITAAGLQPLACDFTPGYMAPSGRERVVQLLAMPFRFLLGAMNPGLAAYTVGGYSLAVLARGRVS